MSATDTLSWNLRSIRQAARVLGAQSSWALDIQGVARAQRLVRDMLERRGFTTDTFHVPGAMPLVIAGSGSVLIVTYLDDSSETAMKHDGDPPIITEGVAKGPGIIRKAGVIAAIGSLFGESGTSDSITLVIEADRHQGSMAIEQWLDRTGRRFSAGLCEVVDLPVDSPTVFPSAVGRMIVKLAISRGVGEVEDVFASVAPDIGHELASAIVSLKSADAEIIIPGYYDTLNAPSSPDIDALDEIASQIGSWLRHSAGALKPSMTDRHATMAMFFAPSIVVRDFHGADSHPFLLGSAHATLDVRLMPGQHPPTVLRSIVDRVTSRSPAIDVSVSLTRTPVVGKLRDRLDTSAGYDIVPLAPGDTPAGTLEERGTPTLGYSVVGRTTSSDGESVDLNRVVAGSEMLRSLALTLAARRLRTG